MKFDRSNKFDLCYYGQVNSLRLKSSVASKWASEHLVEYHLLYINKLDDNHTVCMSPNIWWCVFFICDSKGRHAATSSIRMLGQLSTLFSTVLKQQHQNLLHKILFTSQLERNGAQKLEQKAVCVDGKILTAQPHQITQ